MLHEQLKRRPVPRSGTQNEPREKENEHTSTANTSDEEHTSTVDMEMPKSGKRLSRTHRTYARKRTRTDRVTAPRYSKSKQHRQQGVTERKPTRKCAKIWLVSCKDCVHHADLQQPKRRSPSAAAPAKSGIACESINERHIEQCAETCLAKHNARPS